MDCCFPPMVSTVASEQECCCFHLRVGAFLCKVCTFCVVLFTWLRPTFHNQTMNQSVSDQSACEYECAWLSLCVSPVIDGDDRRMDPGKDRCNLPFDTYYWLQTLVHQDKSGWYLREALLGKLKAIHGLAQLKSLSNKCHSPPVNCLFSVPACWGRSPRHWHHKHHKKTKKKDVDWQSRVIFLYILMSEIKG